LSVSFTIGGACRDLRLRERDAAGTVHLTLKPRIRITGH